MICLTPETRQEYEDQLQKKQALLVTLYEAYNNFDGVEQYKFQSDVAVQQTKYRSMKEIQDAIDRLEAQIRRIRHILNGSGLNNLILRRTGWE